jgi:hypothetical protein
MPEEFQVPAKHQEDRNGAESIQAGNPVVALRELVADLQMMVLQNRRFRIVAGCWYLYGKDLGSHGWFGHWTYIDPGVT